jgi:hypothetical protein
MRLEKGQPRLEIGENPSKKPYQAKGRTMILDCLGQQ